jgi:hypothetical protein
MRRGRGERRRHAGLRQGGADRGLPQFGDLVGSVAEQFFLRNGLGNGQGRENVVRFGRAGRAFTQMSTDAFGLLGIQGCHDVGSQS